MSGRNLKWGLCVSVLFGLPAACGGGSDSPNNSQAGASSGGAAHAGQSSSAGTAGAVHQAGAPAAGEGGTNAGAGANNAGANNAGANNAGANNAGANNGGAGASNAGANNGGGGASNAGANNGGGGASNAGANNGGASNAGANNGGAGASNAGANNGGAGASNAGANNGGGGTSSGGGGQGGSSAGSGGSGGAVQLGCGQSTILDDMEDGNGVICPHPVRAGGWFVATSSGVTTTPSASTSLVAHSLAADPRGSSLYGMMFAGNGFATTTPWATIGTSVGGSGAYDASGYTSVSFWGKSHTGQVSVRVNLSTTETRSVANGGTCTGTCDDSYGTYVTFNNTWQQYTVTFANTTQGGWGTVAARNMAHLHTVEFNYSKGAANPASFEFLVDDLVFNN